MALLTEDEIRDRLPNDWEGAADEIRKEYTFGTFPTAIAFVNLLADAAEEANHHPDIDIRYNRVTVSLSTHAEGGVTQNDLDLSARAESLA